MSNCEGTRLPSEAWYPAPQLKWAWGPRQAPSLWRGAPLPRGAAWEGEFPHWKALASEATGNPKLRWRGRECYRTWKSYATHEVCVFQVVWLWYLTGGSSQLAALFPRLNRLSWDIECGAEHMTRSYCKGTRDKSGQGPERPLWEKVLLVGKWTMAVMFMQALYYFQSIWNISWGASHCAGDWHWQDHLD